MGWDVRIWWLISEISGWCASAFIAALQTLRDYTLWGRSLAEQPRSDQSKDYPVVVVKEAAEHKTPFSSECSAKLIGTCRDRFRGNIAQSRLIGIVIWQVSRHRNGGWWHDYLFYPNEIEVDASATFSTLACYHGGGLRLQLSFARFLHAEIEVQSGLFHAL